jgi:uncharacterized protein YkwD
VKLISLFLVLLAIFSLTPVTPASAVTYNEQVIVLINEARSTGRYCGTQWYPATRPVVRNTKLAKSSRGHSRDMGVRNYFAHSRSGSTLKSRLKKVKYRWRSAGEIIAAGQPSPERVVQAWLDSPGHCKNIMNPKFRDAGSGFVIIEGSRYTKYWTVEFGRRR